jgi:hypothetical protein
MVTESDFRINVRRGLDSGYSPWPSVPWTLITDCWTELSDHLDSDYYSPFIPVIAGNRYRIRIVTTVPAQKVRLWLPDFPSTIETCEISNMTCIYPTPSVSQTPNVTPTPLHSGVSDSTLVECGTSGVLYSIHEPGKPEEWRWTSTVQIMYEGGTPAFISFAGSWVAPVDGTVSFNIDYGPYGYNAWHLTSDCADIWSDKEIRDYKSDKYRVYAGYRYRFRLSTHIALGKSQLWWFPSPSNLDL